MKFSVRDATYAYEISGDGPPVLLLHGFTGSQKTWLSLREQLADQFQVITIDLPGHGKSSAQSISMEQCCEDLAAFLSFVNVEQVHIIGYSMGGRVALSFAIQFPELVASLILESASPGLERKSERIKRVEKDELLAQKIEKEGITRFIDFWENIPLFETQKRLPSTIQHKVRKERLSQQEVGLATSLRTMGTGQQPSWWQHLHQVSCRTLLLVGQHDQKFVTINKQMEQRIPQAQLRIVSDAGHAIHVEQPDVFDKLVVSFLQK